ncbi:uncharacterized protein LOC107428479 [Ziziphus jujuba]|nr:uncharacterized protein LOC107428479 [Ziziphus jujuba]XP_048318766.1 uncharacterized protein LOC107428479 [Ziziphus jujuba]
MQMNNEQMMNKDMKVEIPSGNDQMGLVGSGGLTRQPSVSKNNCLCSPTTHAGSFRCRLHRTPSLQRTKSMDSASSRESTSKPNTTTA